MVSFPREKSNQFGKCPPALMPSINLTDRTLILLQDLKKILEPVFVAKKLPVLTDYLAIGIALSIAIESFADEEFTKGYLEGLEGDRENLLTKFRSGQN
jgi:hypothetical protein